MTIILYGIPNCDTVKKARAWLAERGIPYRFHDFKKEGADPQNIARWIAAEGWQSVLNRRGTTFRKLPDEDKADLDESRAARLMEAHPSAIKRPVVEYAGGVLVGFSEDEWQAALG